MRLRAIRTSVFRVPTDAREADGTYAWDATTMVVVEIDADGATGIGWTYAHAAAADLARGLLWRALADLEDVDTPAAWIAMNEAVRNVGRPGLASEAISAMDIALWDLKAKLLGLSVADLLGRARRSVPLYGSGGFTSYDDRTLAAQLGGWAESGFRAVKMKVGTDPARDLHRVRIARAAIGPDVQLFVDANGAYDRKQALAFADAFAREGVVWFEEPVSSDDVEGLRVLRDHAPAPMEITAGEYGYVLADFRRLVDARCLDVMQADVTRCGGITGMLAVDSLCDVYGLPLSLHCAPQIHAHVGCALRRLRHAEYFHDHARIERRLFEGTIEQRSGRLEPDARRPGLGVRLSRAASEYRIDHRS